MNFGQAQVKRVGYFSGVTYWGGGEVHLRAQLRAITREGHDAVVFCREGLPMNLLFDGVNTAQVEVVYVDSIEKINSAMRRCLAYRRLFASHRLNALHFNGHDYVVPAMASRWARIPRVVANYHILPDEGEPAARQRLKLHLFFRSVHHIIYNCESSREQWQRILPKRHSVTCSLVHSGVDIEHLKTPTAEDRLRARAALGIAMDAPVVGNVARLHQMKGHKDLIDAAVAVVKKFPDVMFVLVGDGPEQGNIEAQIRNHNLAANFRLAGFTEDVVHLWPAFDLMALPSLFKETCSMTSLEAMACSVPLVVSDVGGLPEIVVDEVTGFVVRKSDVAGLGAAIIKMLDDPARRAQMGAASRQRVEQQFTVGRMTSNTIKCYQLEKSAD